MKTTWLLIALALLALSGFRPFEGATWALAYARVPFGFRIGADELLGTQRDPWDTQSDMLAALVGAVTALLLTSRIHDRQIGALERRRASSAGPAR